MSSYGTSGTKLRDQTLSRRPDHLWDSPIYRSPIGPGPIGQSQTSAEEIPVPVLCPRCGSKQYRDVVIHSGQTIRRDCGNCGRFIDFPLWHGELTVVSDSEPVLADSPMPVTFPFQQGPWR